MNSRRDLSRVRIKVQACLLLVRRFYLGSGIFMVLALSWFSWAWGTGRCSVGVGL